MADKIETATWEEIKELYRAAKQMMELFDDGHAMSRFDWGKAWLRAQDIRELNESPLRLKRAILRIEADKI